METIDRLKLEKIVIDTNTRRSMNPAKLKELAANVAKVGVLEPVLVRRRDDEYVLIAGHRRLAASKEAGLKDIPVRVLDVDEKAAAEIQALENLHREDLGAVDEARSFKMLLDLGGHTVESLAARVDKSGSYVYRALRLLELPEAMLNALDDGTITPGHAHQVLRAPEKNWEGLIKFVLSGHTVTINDLKWHIRQKIEKLLSEALFPKNVEYAGAMACTGCPFNTGNQEMLFDGAEEGRCTNPGCFTKKTTTYWKELEDRGARKFPTLKYIGAGTEQSWRDEQAIKGMPVVDGNDAKVKKALEKNPAAFAYGYLSPDSGKPRLVLTCVDQTVLGKKEAGTSAAPQQSDEENQKGIFIERQIIRAYYAALLKASYGKDDLIDLVMLIEDQVYGSGKLLLEAAGISLELESEAQRKLLEKMSEKTLLAILILFQIDPSGIEQAMKRHGIPPAPIRKAVFKSALAEWQKKKKEEAPAA